MRVATVVVLFERNTLHVLPSSVIASSVTTNISSEIDRQIEEFITQMTEKEFDDFVNSAQLQKQPHTSFRFAMPKADEAVRTAQNKQFQKASKGAQNGPAEFGMSGAKVKERITVNIHHDHTCAVMRAASTVGYLSLF